MTLVYAEDYLLASTIPSDSLLTLAGLWQLSLVAGLLVQIQDGTREGLSALTVLAVFCAPTLDDVEGHSQ